MPAESSMVENETKSKAASHVFGEFANMAARWAGRPAAFILAAIIVIVWGVTGPLFRYSDTWQLVINTGTTIITFLMVFIIQKSQNKDSKSLQLKLNELIAANKSASNRLIDVENLSEEELDVLHKYYCVMVEETKKRLSMTESHSVEEAIGDAISKHEEHLLKRKAPDKGEEK